MSGAADYIPTEEIHEILDGYDRKNIAIATVTSHSGIPTMYGAREEDFRTLLVCNNPRRKKVYQSFAESEPDEFIDVADWKDVLSDKVQDRLIEENTIIVPNGSFVEYIKPENLLKKFRVPQFGNRFSLEWESDRSKQRAWLEGEGGLKMPKQYLANEMKDGKLKIVKFSGAKGGRGFFKIRYKTEMPKIIDELVKSGTITKEDAKDERKTIQEYIDGARYYHHMFFSPLDRKREWQVKFKGRKVGRLELNGMDRRDETNIDDLHRTGMSPAELKKAGIWPSYTVCGNIPIYLRESLLPDVFEMGEKTVEASMELFPPGVIGPFCLETFCRADLKFVTFEISARIVAGTSVYATGSPYAVYDWGAKAEMSMARRIAREIKIAARTDRLKEVIV